MMGPLSSKATPPNVAVERPELERPAQRVPPGAGDHQLHQDHHGVGGTYRNEVRDEHGEAEHPRLPVERKGSSEPAVRVPQRKLAVVHLMPHQIGPWHELSDLVGLDGIVHGDSGLACEAEPGEQVKGSERHAGPKHGQQHEDGAHHRERHADHVVPRVGRRRTFVLQSTGAGGADGALCLVLHAWSLGAERCPDGSHDALEVQVRKA